MPGGPLKVTGLAGQRFVGGPAIKQPGSGVTLSTTSSATVQPPFCVPVRRSVAEAEETRTTVESEAGVSMVAAPETKVHIVELIGRMPEVAAP